MNGGPTNPTLLASGGEFPKTFLGQLDRVFSTAQHLFTGVSKSPGLALPKPTPFAVGWLLPQSIGGAMENAPFGIAPEKTFLTFLGLPFSRSIREDRDLAQKLFEQQQISKSILNDRAKALIQNPDDVLRSILTADRLAALGREGEAARAVNLRQIAEQRGLLTPGQRIQPGPTIFDAPVVVDTPESIAARALPATKPLAPPEPVAPTVHPEFALAVGQLGIGLLMFLQSQNPADP
jgi:hypothetical protein